MKTRDRLWIQIAIIMIISGCAVGFTQEAKPEKVLFDQALNFYKNDQYSEAIESFTKVANISVDKILLYRTYLYLGYIHFALGENDDAHVNVLRMLEYQQGLALDEKEFAPKFIKFVEDAKKEIVGIAFFESIPASVQISLNQELLGETPLKRELLAKKYDLRLVKWGYTPIEQEIEIKKGEINSFRFNLNGGKNWKTFGRSVLLMIMLSVTMNRI